MRKALIYTIMMLLSVSAFAKGEIVQMGPSFIKQLQERDSVLIADQVFYGFELPKVEEGTVFAFAQISDTLMTNVLVVKPWQMDTVSVTKQKKGKPNLLDLKGGLTITTFDEGIYHLPPLSVLRCSKDGVLDTLIFDPQVLEVKTMPVDTATFKPHDIKGIIKYPLTFLEVLPWVLGFIVFVGLIILIVWLIRRYLRKRNPEYIRKEPAYLVALRKLDKYRGNALWAPETQKEFYSGVTDVLREYISARFGFGAMEMTTAEIFGQMQKTDVPADLQDEMRDLFERADYVKFAKFTASNEDNAKALPVAVRFVTSTYQTELDNETSSLPSVSQNDNKPVMSSEVETSANMEIKEEE